MEPTVKKRVDDVRRLLTETGERALPYKEEVKFGLETHLKELFKDFPGLNVKSEDYIYNDGRSVRLLLVDGTVPMYYQEARYNIPVNIWLTEKYPHEPPIVYVTPTQGMVIKPDHSCVDSSGVVHSLYLKNWSMSLSNLVDLAYDMGIQFGQEPPLFSKPPAYPPSNTTNTYATPSRVFQGNNPMVRPEYLPSGGRPVTNPYVSSTYQAPQAIANQGQWWPGQHSGRPAEQRIVHGQQSPNPTNGDVMEAFRSVVVKGLSKRLTTSMESYGTEIRKDIQKAGEVRDRLNAHAQDITKKIAALQEERGLLEARVRMMALKSSEIAAWLQQVGGKVSQIDETVDPDTVIVPDGPLCKQLLDTHAEDMAIEDALAALDKALHLGVIGLDAYLKQVRKLSRKQFFARALGLKVHEANSRSLQGTGNHRASGYMNPQGVSWAPSGMLMNPLVPGSRQ